MKNKKDIKGLIFFIILVVILSPILIINMTIIVKSYMHPNSVPDFMGYKPFIVMSGSMQNTLNIGDLIITKNVDTKSIKENDIIAFDSEDVIVTHRVIKVTDENGSKLYATKGDKNNIQDLYLVNESQIEGKVVKTIPKIGYAFLFISRPLGIMTIIIFIFAMAEILYFYTFKQSKEEKELMREFLEFKKQKEKERKELEQTKERVIEICNIEKETIEKQKEITKEELKRKNVPKESNERKKHIEKTEVKEHLEEIELLEQTMMLNRKELERKLKEEKDKKETRKKIEEIEVLEQTMKINREELKKELEKLEII